MRLRPCIDIHNGQVKQIVGSSLKDEGDSARENFVAKKDAAYYACLYRDMGLSGGHIVLLNSKDSPEYEATLNQGLAALKAAPGLLQIGGGVTAENAQSFLDAGASHVIVTSYVFKDGQINYTNLDRLVKEVGKERIVLDLSCKASDDRTSVESIGTAGDRSVESVESIGANWDRSDDGGTVGKSYYIVTDRWQKMTDVRLCLSTLDELSSYCDEFLVHAADVEGKQNGIEEGVATMLGHWSGLPITYAGGIHSIDEVLRLKKLSGGNLDFTIGSALSLFGGTLEIENILSVLK